MRHLVGFSWLVGLSAGLAFGCAMSTVGTMDPVEGGKCDKPMQTVIAKDGCTPCTCGHDSTWNCSGNVCMGSGGSSAGTGGAPMAGKGGSGTGKGGADTGSGGSNIGKGGSDVGSGGTAAATGGTDMGSGGGPNACTPGDNKLADDGCNTCSCTMSGDWACTELGCTACTPGETAMEVGCQVCTCNADGSGWGCVATACNDECPPPVAFDPNQCTSSGGYAQNPATSYCCAYASSCAAPQGWPIFATPDCKPLVCAHGTGDCDEDPSNGCETDLTSSPNDCGGCGMYCLKEGESFCTNGVCGPPPPAPPQCVYEAIRYDAGDSFPSRDGCNTCECDSSADGTVFVSCTEVGCTCDPDNEPYRKYAGTSSDACETLDFMCPDNTTMFDNDCGCGCEQSEQCPDVFDCSAEDRMKVPSTCDRSLIPLCPYSTVQATPTN